MGSWDKLGYIAFKMAATKSSKDARQVGLSWHEKRVKSEKSQRRESILDLHSSVFIIMKFCYCWSLFCRGQSKGRRPRIVQLEV